MIFTKYKKTRYYDVKPIVIFVLSMSICLYLIISMYNSFRPTLEIIALNECTYITRKAINDRILTKLYEYPNIVNYEKDNENRVVALSTNMPVINSVKADILNSVNEIIKELEYKEISIPLGNIVNGEFFTGFGPEITVNILGLGVSDAEFISEFSSAGINQTRHRVLLEISADITVVLPGQNITTTIITEYAVSETVLLGVVPNSYTYIDDQESSLLGKLNDYAE